ncbi:MAG: hypothetical protein LC748_12375, partial [Thermomicrobia bacterium]|nr:hypothetical protein [Thermomicrobia bacterium]
MGTYQMVAVIEEIRALTAAHDPTADESSITHYRFRVEPPIPWDKSALEAALQITIPPDVEVLWNHVSSLHLFMVGSNPDETGVEIAPPSELMPLRKGADRLPLAHYLHADDLIVGADTVLWDFFVVVRCNPAISDFGYVFVTEEMEERHEWVYA